MSKKTKSATQQIRELIDKGWTAKRIAAKVGCKPQRVYAVRYQINKARGLGAIGATVPNPIDGIGVPPRRRGRPRRALLAGTGISLPVQPVPILETYAPFMPIEKPSLWTRIKNFFGA
tara:strand:- start:6707 stop:7060 length:354 start_codon:yes stop_codon:yes gene_type:complete